MNHQRTGLAFFGGGVDTTKDPVAVDEGQVIASENLIPKGDGLALRPGFAQLNSTSVGSPILWCGVADFKDKQAFVCASKTTVYATTDATGLTSIGSITNTDTDENSVWTGCTVNNICFLATPKAELKTWTGTISGSQLVEMTDVADYEGPAVLGGRFVTRFAGRPVLGYVTDDDGTNPHRLRWPIRTTVATGAGWKKWTGTGAGAVDLDDHPGYITGLTVFNGILIIFKSESIVFGFETGDSLNPIRFQRGGNVGCLSGRTFQPITPDAGVFLSRNGLYLLTAAGATPIGEEVRRYLFGPSTDIVAGRVADLYTNKTRLATSWIDSIDGSYWLALVLQGGNYPGLGINYSPKQGRWTAHFFAEPATASTQESYRASVNGAPIPTKPRAIVCTVATSTGYVCTFDTDVNYDRTASNLIDGWFKTKDIRLYPTGYATLYAIHINLTGLGATWTNVSGTLTVEVDGDRAEDSSKLVLSAPFSLVYTGQRAQRITIPVNVSAAGYRQHQTALYHRIKVLVDQTTSTTGVQIHIPAIEVEWLPRWDG